MSIMGPTEVARLIGSSKICEGGLSAIIVLESKDLFYIYRFTNFFVNTEKTLHFPLSKTNIPHETTEATNLISQANDTVKILKNQRCTEKLLKEAFAEAQHVQLEDLRLLDTDASNSRNIAIDYISS